MSIPARRAHRAAAGDVPHSLPPATGPTAPLPPDEAPLAALSEAPFAETPLEEAAAVLARQLEEVPGILNQADTRLADLSTLGPPAAAELWEVAHALLGARYGATTVREFLERFNTRRSGR